MGEMPITVGRRTVLKAISGSTVASGLLSKRYSAQDTYPITRRWAVPVAAQLQQELNDDTFTATVRATPSGHWCVEYTGSQGDDASVRAQRVQEISRAFLKILNNGGHGPGTLYAYVYSEDGSKEVAHWKVEASDIMRIPDEDLTRDEYVPVVFTEYMDELLYTVLDTYRIRQDFDETYLYQNRRSEMLTDFLNSEGIPSQAYTNIGSQYGINLFYTTKSSADASLDGDFVQTEINVIAYAYAFLASQLSEEFDPHLFVRIRGEEYFYRGEWFLNVDSAHKFNKGEWSEEEYEESIYATVEPFRFECRPTKC